MQNTSYATANLDFGYKVTAAMAADATTANLYLDGDETSEYYIAPVENARLGDNTWGYRLSEEDEDYLTIPLANTPSTIIKGNDNKIEDKPVDIYYTIKADKSLPAGTYTGEIEYTLTDNNFPATLTTMQGMTTEICENTFTPGNSVTDPVPTATLEDIRDHKTYTIAKLADGNCWMTQNLDLDLSTEITLTPADTDVSESWTPKNSTLVADGTSVPGWSNSGTEPYSADPGDVYYYTSGTDADDIEYNSLDECEETGHTDCSHYHAGNYYNWSAAVASNDTSGITTQYENAPDSICPAGWRLPKNANAESYIEGNEQMAMVTSYNGILGESQSGPPGGYYRYLEGGFNAIRTVPLWLSRSGIIESESIADYTVYGDYWSSTVYSSGGANSLFFNRNAVIPSMSTYGVSRFYGHSVRCMAQ